MLKACILSLIDLKELNSFRVVKLVYGLSCNLQTLKTMRLVIASALPTTHTNHIRLLKSKYFLLIAITKKE